MSQTLSEKLDKWTEGVHPLKRAEVRRNVATAFETMDREISRLQLIGGLRKMGRSDEQISVAVAMEGRREMLREQNLRDDAKPWRRFTC